MRRASRHQVRRGVPESYLVVDIVDDYLYLDRSDGKQMYSSYAEVGYTHSFTEDNNIALCVGANLNKGFYTNNESGFNVVNINAKYSTAFKFGNFKLPVSASYVLNPYNNKSYFTMSLYFGL